MPAGPQSFLQRKTILALNLTLAFWFLSSCFPKGKRNQRGRGFWQKQNTPILLQLYFYLRLPRTDLVLFVGRLSVSLLRGCLWVACVLKQPPSGESVFTVLLLDGQRKWDWAVASLSYIFSIHPRFKDCSFNPLQEEHNLQVSGLYYGPATLYSVTSEHESRLRLRYVWSNGEPKHAIITHFPQACVLGKQCEDLKMDAVKGTHIHLHAISIYMIWIYISVLLYDIDIFYSG